MIIVRLKGGLGNQLFQYAMARSMSLRKNTTVKMDAVSGFKNDIYGRVYSLKHFNIVEELATEREIAKFIKPDRKRSRSSRSWKRFKPYYKRPVVVERYQFMCDPNILRITDDVYLDGYWQNERYFKDFADIIRKELTVRTEPDGVNREFARTITNTNAVSLHVRRLHGVAANGTQLPHVTRLFGACSLEYYKTAVRLVTARLSNPHFFVFGDDPEWARENIRLDFPTVFVTHNGKEKDYQDLRLMSLCKHHVIANSAFSWWGAWLCANPDKIVFAPQKWLSESEHDTRDLIPDGWCRI